ncbi:sensor histidine kinase [Clostridium sp. UBA1652]|uniref:sensor histidine kinase n=1 Tax=Clostridium sp. UBA1652 TaxID=1946348 RepID=UPI00257BE946|nr:GHKL domain-containing protein [Clostridium sp. UBA1652]
MDQYSSVIVVVLYTYITIINLSNMNIKFKETIFMVFITILLSAVLFKVNTNLKIIACIIGGVVYLYRNSRDIIYSIMFTVASIILILIIDYALCALHYMMTNSGEFGFVFYISELLTIFFVSYLLGKITRKSKLRLIDILLNYKFWILMIIPIILIIIRVYMAIVAQDIRSEQLEKVNIFLFFITFTLIILIMYIGFRGVTKEVELKSKQINFEVLQNYTTKIEGMYSDMRAFKHDYANIISSMIGYIDEEDMTGLKKHFYDNILPLSQEIGRNDLKIAGLKNMRIVEVKGLLSSKLIRAQEMGIEVFIDIKEPIEKIDMYIIDLIRVLGILLNNAIEEGENNDKHIIRFGFIRADNVLIMIVSNSCREDIPPIYKINKKGYSTKGANRGIGLSNLRDILDKYKYVTLDTIIQDEEFIQKITIENNFGKGR